ncbi:hypothetical protein [Thermus thermophilus]|nr:hypothetical protein [Thermus thermophilus]
MLRTRRRGVLIQGKVQDPEELPHPVMVALQVRVPSGAEIVRVKVPLS